MRDLRRLAVVAGVLAVAAAGCGVGEGEREAGSATLTVTRDFGSESLHETTVQSPSVSDTVVRVLDREAEIETSYGGNFVDSIDGISGRADGGRSEDWFFYVNGYWSPVGAGEARVHAGDRIWWDYRDWTDAYRVPAVVGSWPEPFVHGRDGRRLPTEVLCFDGGEACGEVAASLREAGAEVSEHAGGEGGGDPQRTLRVLVGSWQQVRADRAAALLERGPSASGVYATPIRCGAGFALRVLDRSATAVGSLPDAAWVAAVQRGDEQPTWLVTATRVAGVGEAAGMLDPAALGDRYAVARSAGEEIPLPASEVPQGPSGAGSATTKGCS